MDDKIRVTCPACKTEGMAPASLAGKRVKCRKCQAVVEIPALAAADGRPAPPPPPRVAPPPPPPPAPPPRVAPPTGQAVVAAQPVEEVMLATQELVGQPCPACRKRIFLGDEVVRCAACGTVNHVHCWRERNGCSSAVCSPPPGGATAAAAEAQVAAATVANMDCPACAEQIPADSNVCPYCGERVGAMAGPGAGGAHRGLAADLPSSFRTLSGKKYVFTLTPDVLVGESVKTGEEIKVLRSDAVSELELTANRLIITSGGVRRKFNIEDIGHVAINHWLTGETSRKSSAVAKDALITAIVGIFCCQVVCGPYAIYRAGQAQKDLAAYPQYLDGEGMATAAKIIGIVDIVIGILGILVNMSQIGGS